MRGRLMLPLFLLTLACVGSASAREAKHPVTLPQSRPSDPGTLAPPPNDQCAGAIVIPCGNILLSGNTALATNDYAFVDTVNSCTGYASYGRDVVYKLNVGVGDSLWINYTNRTDGSIYLVTNCSDIDHTCVAGADDFSNPNSTEQLKYKFTTSGIYYLILDSYGANTGDLWTASGQLVCGAQTPPSNDLCETAKPIVCGTFNYSGSTQFAHNYYYFHNPPYFCTGNTANGNDVVYSLSVAAGDSLWVDYVNMNANGSMYLVSDCNAVDNTCLWGEDQNPGANQIEQLRYRFEYSGLYYLILDARESNGWGAWTASGALICQNPPPLNDRCDTATPLVCGEYSGSTQYAVNNYYFGNNPSCTGFPVDGRDVVYSLHPSVGDTLQVSYRSINSDGAVFLVRNCADIANTCVMGVDETVTSEFENLTYVFPDTGAYYLILDSTDLESWSTWTMTAYYRCATLAVNPDGPAARLELREIAPNPARGKINLFYELPARANATLKVYDLQGRTMRTLVDGELDAGQHHLVWDGTDEHGQRLQAGVYFAKLMSGQGGVVRRVIFVK